VVALASIVAGCGTADSPAASPAGQSAAARTMPSSPAPEGMIWIPGGEFTMGSDDARSMANERPAHRVRVPAFWMDVHPVTNVEFARFVDATGYVTVAERAPVWDEMRKSLPPGTPRPADSQLVPGSLVFVPPGHAVPLDDMSAWWRWTPGASWRHPEGPGSTLSSRERHPVVHVAWDDAVAYAKWAGKRLPTEAEWEFAARGGLEAQRYAWGGEFRPAGRHMANTFQGQFPHHAASEDGFAGTSPVGSFPANGYGLRDVVGNVWQWTADLYREDVFAERAAQGVCDNPQGPASTFDPADPYAVRRVIKGGSFLCHVTYCESYRPSARRGTPPDTGSSHVGFRLVKSAG
jgi:sulfatase modifying factor 1